MNLQLTKRQETIQRIQCEICKILLHVAFKELNITNPVIKCWVNEQCTKYLEFIIKILNINF